MHSLQTALRHSESDDSHQNRDDSDEKTFYSQEATVEDPIPEEDTSIASVNNHPSNNVVIFSPFMPTVCNILGMKLHEGLIL